MKELEEVLDDIDARIFSMRTAQIERWFSGGWTSAEAFLNSEREEQYTKRMIELFDAKFAIHRILGRKI